MVTVTAIVIVILIVIIKIIAIIIGITIAIAILIVIVLEIVMEVDDDGDCWLIDTLATKRNLGNLHDLCQIWPICLYWFHTNCSAFGEYLRTRYSEE